MSARSAKRAQLELDRLARSPIRDVYVTRASPSGVSLHIITPPDRLHVDGPENEAASVLDALLELPVETRRALYLLMTQESADTFNGVAAAKTTKVHPPLKGGSR